MKMPVSKGNIRVLRMVCSSFHSGPMWMAFHGFRKTQLKMVKLLPQFLAVA